MLTVGGVARFENFIEFAGSISTPGTAAAIYRPADNNLAFSTASTERLRIDSSGNVGIGTSSPTRPLTVASSTGATNILGVFDNSGTTATNCIIAFSDPTSTQGQFSTRLGSVGNSLAFYTNGSNERLRIDSSGNVGIGTTSALRSLHIAGAGDTGLMLQTTGAVDNNEIWEIQVAGNASNHADLIFRSRTNAGTGGSEAMRIDSSGNVGINQTDPDTRLDVDGAFFLRPTAQAFPNENGAGLRLRSDTNRLQLRGLQWTPSVVYYDIDYLGLEHEWFGNGSSKMKLDSSGNLLVGKTGSNFAVQGVEIRGAGEITLTRQGDLLTTRRLVSEGVHMSIRSVNGTTIGTISTNGTNASFNTSSDYRLKENVDLINDGIVRVKQLTPKRFNFISNPDLTVDGFIAHEAQAVVPEAVTGEKDGEEMQGIDQSKLVPLLTAALQEAIDKIETLEAKVAALEAGIA